jgi:hypothetical protein
MPKIIILLYEIELQKIKPGSAANKKIQPKSPVNATSATLV